MRQKLNNMHSNGLVVAATILGDFIIAMLTYWLFNTVIGTPLDNTQLHTSILIGVIYCACILNGGVILYIRNVKRFQIVTLVTRNVLLFVVLSVPLLRLGHFNHMSYKILPLFLFSLIFMVSAYRIFVRWAVISYRRRGKSINRVVFLGSKENNISLYKEMLAISSLGYQVVGYFDDQPNQNFPKECKFLGKTSEVIDYLKGNHSIHELFCCLPSSRADEILPIIHFCEKNFIHFYNVPNVTNYLHHRVYFNMLGNVPYLSLYREPLPPRKPCAEACLRHRGVGSVHGDAVPYHFHHRGDNNETDNAGADFLQAEKKRTERQRVLLLQIPQHEGER